MDFLREATNFYELHPECDVVLVPRNFLNRKTERKRKISFSSPKRLLSTAEAADYLNTSVWTLRRLVYRKDLRAIRGRSWKFDVKDLDKWIEEKKEGE